MNEIFLNRCRACAGLQENSETMVSLFSEKNVSEIFTHCTSLEIASHDGLPSHVCFECFGHLSSFNKFRQSCVNSDKSFRERLTTESFKIESFDEKSMKQEEGEPSVNIESECHETKFGDEDSSNNDSDSFVNVPIKSIEDNSSHGDRDSILNDPADFNLFDRTKYVCDYCGQQFNQKNHISSHMTRHKHKVKQRVLKFQCTVKGCVKIFEKKSLLNKHQRNVHKIKPTPCVKVATVGGKRPKFSCEQCPKQFQVQHKLDAHIREEHEGLKPYQCVNCEKEFCTVRAYKHHIRFRHSNDEREVHPCTVDGCNKTYPLRDSLRDHIKRFHLGIKPDHKRQTPMCDQCGRTFKNAYNLREHSYTHSGITPYPCKICPKKFKSSYQLKIHTRRHLKIKPFACSICGERKTTNRELKSHMNYHTKEKTYPCKECPRVFGSYAGYNRHDRIHHRNLKPYVCPHCQQAFAQADTLKYHVMTHTGEKPFACPVCGHRFIQPVALKSHMKVHEKKLS